MPNSVKGLCHVEENGSTVLVIAEGLVDGVDYAVSLL
jgi:hypothetical protein